MRKDENGNPCPATLGEYRDLVEVLAPESKAIQYLDKEIAGYPNGRDELVVLSDREMRAIIMPKMLETAEWDRLPENPAGDE